MQNLDVDEAKHDDKQHRKDGKDDDVTFTPVKYVLQHVKFLLASIP